MIRNSCAIPHREHATGAERAASHGVMRHPARLLAPHDPAST
jgi:hypothetical protein